ncbi:DUF397 domain-containing protein [Nocardiopsis sediminis]|uniref:DUF397 domain-containing protein n=1 Tax=Nocardiopsis sediminis TaxID=1778267 RepID=A0ABV8FWR2_9ACTN
MRSRTPEWHKSSYSGAQGSCVEVAEGEVVRIRDTQHRELGALAFPVREWGALLADIDAL